MNNHNEISEHINDYSSYLQAQVDKFSLFMLSQKKLNQQHLNVQNNMAIIMKNISKLQQKFDLLNIHQKDSMFQIKKLSIEYKNIQMMSLRIQNLQNQLKSNCKSNHNFNYSHNYNFQKPVYQTKADNNDKRSNSDKQISSLFQVNMLKKNELQIMINQVQQQFQFKIKKIQMQAKINKQCILKLTTHLNSLSKTFQFRRSKINTQSTKDIQLSYPNIVTKKELYKMQKKMQNFFIQKLEQIHSKEYSETSEKLSKSLNKNTKFKTIQQKYQKLTGQAHNLKNQYKYQNSQRKDNKSEKRYSSLKKLQIFQNSVLKSKNLNKKQRFERKNKVNEQKSQKKGQKLKPKSKNKNRKTSNSKSVYKLQKVHNDYMINIK